MRFIHKRGGLSLLSTLVYACILSRRTALADYPRRNNARQQKRFLRPLIDVDNRITIENMTCQFLEQPLNHFDLPRGTSPTFPQRYCTYNQFAILNNDTLTEATVFFYTGNESPLEEYINNTGLLWQLAEKEHALVVFAEHRYEGQSQPDPSIRDCMAYSSAIQATADYARLLQLLYNNHHPIIAFGGSYGGMLSAYMRMLYPSVVAGAIAASAPIWGFPLVDPTNIDGAYKIVKRGLEQSMPPTVVINNQKTDDNKNNHCASNLLASWPLMAVLGKSEEGRELLKTSLSLCNQLKEKDMGLLVAWAQSPWFDLAESSYPYESSYIPFALTHNPNAKLPAWPLQHACWNNSQLHTNFGITFKGNTSNVSYVVSYGESGLSIAVDWNNATIASPGKGTSPVLSSLLTSVRDAISVWFNITKDVTCYNLAAAPNKSKHTKEYPNNQTVSLDAVSTNDARLHQHTNANDTNHTAACAVKMAQGSWSALCCNEEMVRHWKTVYATTRRCSHLPFTTVVTHHNRNSRDR
jgi:pimeloyl-ACP methyl ester carboxylesterase